MSTNTEQNTIDATVEDDLDLFSSEFFGQNKGQPETAISEEEDSSDDASTDAQIEQDDTQSGDDDTSATEEDDEDDEGEEEDEAPVAESEPKPKKSRFQERIDELTAKAREEERQRIELQRKLDELIAQSEVKKEEPKAPAPKAAEDAGGPKPDDTNEDGTEKYPLGEFDPRYIRDLSRFIISQENEAVKQREAEEAQQREIEAQKEALQSSWNEKLVPAQERYPDFQEKGQQLIDSFAGIDQQYGEYLTQTLMEMDYGPDVFYYLANNVDEARKIVDSGPKKAVMAFGRLETKFAIADEEKQKARPKVSKAPTPPPTNKGSAVAVAEVPDDTEDLDAFAKKLFNKKRR